MKYAVLSLGLLLASCNLPCPTCECDASVCGKTPMLGTFDVSATYRGITMTGSPASPCQENYEKNDVVSQTWRIEKNGGAYSLIAQNNSGEQIIGTSDDGYTFGFRVSDAGLGISIVTDLLYCDDKFVGEQRASFIVSPDIGGQGSGSCTENWDVMGVPQ